ncbi:MAG: hypothetical protein ACOVOV_05450, partial [Dolichospermum sp.]
IGGYNTSYNCPNGNLTFQTSYTGTTVSPITYSWSGPNGFSSTLQNPTVTNLSSQSQGVYTVTANFVNDCFTTTATTLSVPVNNPVTTASNNSSTQNCIGSSVQLNSNYIWNSTLTASYSWTGPNGFTSSLQNPSIILSQTTTGIYTVVATFNNCGSSSATTLVSISPLSVAAGASRDGFLCESNSVDLYAYINGSTFNTPPSPTTTSFSWTGPNGFVSSLRNPSLSNLTTANSGFYTVTVTLSNGCSGTYTSMVGVNVTKNPELVISQSSGSFPCANSSITLNPSTNPLGSTVATYLWQGPNGYSSTATSPTISPMGSGGVYTVTGTFTGGCVGTYSTLAPIYVTKTPNIFLSQTTTGCIGSTLNLPSIYANPNTGLTYSWTGPNGFTGSNQTGINILVSNSATTAMAGIYTLTITDATNRCPLPYTATTNVTLSNCICNVNVSNSSIGVCQGGSTSLGASFTPSNTIVNYTWTGPNGYSSNSQYPSTVTNINSSGVYTVTASVLSGICLGTYTSTVTVNILTPNNSPSTSIFSSGSACEGGWVNFNLSSNGTDILNYRITGPNGFNYYGNTFQTYNASYNSYPSIYLDNPTTNMSGTYTITANLQGRCNGAYGQQTSTANVVVNPRPAAPNISANITSINAGESVTLTGSGCSGTNSLRWLTNTTTNPLIDNPPFTTTYWAICNPSSGCWSGSSNRITVTVANCPQNLSMSSPTDNYNTGIFTRQANATTGIISATNRITGS